MMRHTDVLLVRMQFCESKLVSVLFRMKKSEVTLVQSNYTELKHFTWVFSLNILQYEIKENF